jgi:limonene-1,2-epoxide hydrolase
MDSQKDLLTLVRKFEDAMNRHAIDEVMDMFGEGAEFEIVGISHFTGKEKIRNVFEYDTAVHTKLVFLNCTAKGDAVTCQIVERNDRLEALGIKEILYRSCIIAFKDGLISEFKATIDVGMARSVGERSSAFVDWISKHCPLQYSRMFTPDGRFIYSGENGKNVVPLMQEWRDILRAAGG